LNACACTVTTCSPPQTGHKQPTIRQATLLHGPHTDSSCATHPQAGHRPRPGPRRPRRHNAARCAPPCWHAEPAAPCSQPPTCSHSLHPRKRSACRPPSHYLLTRHMSTTRSRSTATRCFTSPPRQAETAPAGTSHSTSTPTSSCLTTPARSPVTTTAISTRSATATRQSST
jgi:hypothetical protein